MENRLAQLQTMISDNPEDAFLNYAIGLEYWKAGDHTSAYKHFAYLVRQHPQYLATYYQLGQLNLERDHPKAAAEVLETGLAVAKEQKAWKTFEELQSALKQAKGDDPDDPDEDEDQEEAFS